MTTFLGFIAPDIQTAIHNYISAKFGSWDEDDQYIEPDIEVVRAWAISTLNDWRITQRAATGLTEASYLNAQRTIATGEGDIAQAAATTAAWDEIERQYNQSVNLVRLAKTISDIELVLARRYNG